MQFAMVFIQERSCLAPRRGRLFFTHVSFSGNTSGGHRVVCKIFRLAIFLQRAAPAEGGHIEEHPNVFEAFQNLEFVCCTISGYPFCAVRELCLVLVLALMVKSVLVAVCLSVSLLVVCSCLCLCLCLLVCMFVGLFMSVCVFAYHIVPAVPDTLLHYVACAGLAYIIPSRCSFAM